LKIYLDTSALGKRYFSEDGSEKIDEYYSHAWNGKSTLVVSLWNIGEFVDVLLRKTRRAEISEIESRELLQDLQGEMLGLRKQDSFVVVPLTDDLVESSWEMAMREKIRVADALQVVTSKQRHCDLFLTGDKDLSGIASKYMNALLLGSANRNIGPYPSRRRATATES